MNKILNVLEFCTLIQLKELSSPFIAAAFKVTLTSALFQTCEVLSNLWNLEDGPFDTRWGKCNLMPRVPSVSTRMWPNEFQAAHNMLLFFVVVVVAQCCIFEEHDRRLQTDLDK